MIIAVVMIRRRSVFFATQREPTNRAAAAEAEARSWHASAPSPAVFAPEVAQDQNTALLKITSDTNNERG